MDDYVIMLIVFGVFAALIVGVNVYCIRRKDGDSGESCFLNFGKHRLDDVMSETNPSTGLSMSAGVDSAGNTYGES